MGCVGVCVCKILMFCSYSFRETVRNVVWERHSLSGSDVFCLMNLWARSMVTDTPKPCGDTSTSQFYFYTITVVKGPRLFPNSKSVLIVIFIYLSHFSFLHVFSMTICAIPFMVISRFKWSGGPSAAMRSVCMWLCGNQRLTFQKRGSWSPH